MKLRWTAPCRGRSSTQKDVYRLFLAADRTERLRNEGAFSSSSNGCSIMSRGHRNGGMRFRMDHLQTQR